MPHPYRASAGFWLETSSGTLLLDISADTPHRMAQERLDWPNLDAIWVSHIHLDHIGGLAPFLFSTKWSPATQTRKKALRIFAPKGVRELVEAVDQTHNYKLFEQPFPLEFVTVSGGEEFEVLDGVRASTFSTPHTEESCAIRLTEKTGKSMVYTSDTGFSGELIEFCRDTTLLLLECSFRRNKPVSKHLELLEAMQIAKKSAPGKLVLTHLYPEWDSIDLANEAKEFWSGETIEARDGLRLTI